MVVDAVQASPVGEQRTDNIFMPPNDSVYQGRKAVAILCVTVRVVLE